MDFVGEFFVKHLESEYKPGGLENMRNFINKISSKEAKKDKNNQIKKKF